LFLYSFATIDFKELAHKNRLDGCISREQKQGGLASGPSPKSKKRQQGRWR
jgi:hypothetical protein